MVILGISLGTRTSGIAILDSGKLITWNTLSFRKEWSEHKAQKIISRYDLYLRNHNVTTVVLKVPPVTHHTEALVTLLKKLQSLFTYHGCMVEYKTKSEVKAAIPELRNTRQLIEYTTDLYHCLIPEQVHELRSKNKYHSKMFEAVLVAHLYKSTIE
jgi:RNase H-fold protein (predicted Holliday junction resolvase)